MENFFEVVARPLETILVSRGFEKEIVNEDTSVIFKNESIAYSVEFDKDKKQFKLNICDVEDGQVSGEWKNKSAWFFDPESSTKRDAEDIANDFKTTIVGTKKVVKQSTKKNNKDQEHNADALFFANRMVNVFPELREEIAREKMEYEEFRGVTFAKERILPKVKSLLNSNVKTGQTKKLFDVLIDMYHVGNLDVRGIITIVLLNSIDDAAQEQMVLENVSEELQKAWKCAKRLKGKTIKPEKIKKKKSFIADTLNSNM